MKKKEDLEKVNKNKRKLKILIILFGILILFIIFMFFLNLNTIQTPTNIIPTDIHIIKETNTTNPTGNSTDILGLPANGPFGISYSTWIIIIIGIIIVRKFFKANI